MKLPMCAQDRAKQHERTKKEKAEKRVTRARFREHHMGLTKGLLQSAGALDPPVQQPSKRSKK